MFEFLKSSFQKIKSALTKTRSLLGGKIRALFSKPWDEATFEELEEILYEADLGTMCVEEFVEYTKKLLRKNPQAGKEEILAGFRELALKILREPATIKPSASKEIPHVIMIVGVNGSGKTTSIAKLARKYQEEKKNVLLAAGDTFRAAAIEQLTTWAERLKCEIVKSQSGGDPAAVAFDALSSARAKKMDLVILDTAGRLQNKTELMKELEKVKRVCTKIIPDAPHETLLVVDATTGQNALDQAIVFNQFTPLTGIILAKLDGSAKGGIALAIYKTLGIPIRWIGVGEKMEDLLPFDAESYVNALFDIE